MYFLELNKTSVVFSIIEDPTLSLWYLNPFEIENLHIRLSFLNLSSSEKSLQFKTSQYGCGKPRRLRDRCKTLHFRQVDII